MGQRSARDSGKRVSVSRRRREERTAPLSRKLASAPSTSVDRPLPAQPGHAGAEELAALQRTIGNRAVARLLTRRNPGGFAGVYRQPPGSQLFGGGPRPAAARQRVSVRLGSRPATAGEPPAERIDAIADLVAPGRRSAGVQREESAPPPDSKVIIGKLDRMLLPVFFGITGGTFAIDGITSWMEHFTQAIADAKTAGGSAAPPELVGAVDRCVALNGPDMNEAAEGIRTATVQLTNDSSVSKKDPVKAVFPTQAQVKRFGAAAAKFTELSRDAGLPAGAKAKSTLQSVGATAQDAALAMLQSLAVVAARDRWKTGTSTETPSADKAGTGPRTELDEIFKDAGWGSRVGAYEVKDDKGKNVLDKFGNKKKRVFDWCGMFVVSSYFKGAGLAQQLRGGFYHTDNVQDFFKYEQLHNAGRAPMSIWAEDQWWKLKEYHKARGTMRQWTPRATIQAALAAGGTGDIRPGDTCLIDHKGGNRPSHIVMVESYDPATKQLVTIEGNTFGILADKEGKAERLDDDHLKKSTPGSGTATGVHVRDMRELAPGPGKYVVTAAEAFIREEGDLTKFKKDDGKKVKIPVDTAVDVTEVKDVGGARFARVTDWGWTKLSNLGTSAKPPKGGYEAASGATVWGVGRPSLVDFEDGHEYAVNPVPAELKTTSPAEMHELAKLKDKTGAAVKKLELK